MSGDEPEGFLGRWSRIKRTAARPEPEPEPESLPDPDSPETDPEPEGVAEAEADPPTLSDEELAALPRIEDLVQGSDIRPFLRAGVPRALKNAALRRMWMLTPAIRDHRDPAVDYAWDWNTPGGVPGDGVAPSPERAAEMLKSLLSPRQTKSEADAEAEGAGDGEAGADQPTEGAGDERSCEVKTIAPTPGAPSSEQRRDEGGPGDPESVAEPDPPVRRRHGSALPG
ncbi:DUF3306 domain-containing protein [Roseicyclus persicicus]|uniref:DUF3306 domain-containing protein n=1 Tax=Roseicyclus persicicus TaxID=2650661 RepID=A0A7X6JX69_9RHOB|nr:DUF3306 domain-containing protein [Roseibacterium persicicum]NKX44490.1 DUF3306 domain-containing protein [Roseibacterium persicicum]